MHDCIAYFPCHDMCIYSKTLLKCQCRFGWVEQNLRHAASCKASHILWNWVWHCMASEAICTTQHAKCCHWHDMLWYIWPFPWHGIFTISMTWHGMAHFTICMQSHGSFIPLACHDTAHYIISMPWHGTFYNDHVMTRHILPSAW